MQTLNRSYYPGLDLLKFIMAIMIVAAHCDLFKEWVFAYNMAVLLWKIAVPTFFTVSAFLFYDKLYLLGGGEKNIIKHSIKRQVLFFIVWYILMIPYAYFTFFKLATPKEIIYAFFLRCSVWGYWFLKALIINTFILYLFRKKKMLIALLFLSLLIHLFFSFNYSYHFVNYPYSPYYSFYYHIVFFAFGGLLARYKNNIELMQKNMSIILVTLFLCVYMMSVVFKWGVVISVLLYPLILIPLFIKIVPQHRNYKILRNYSILLYVMQFVLIWVYNLLFPPVEGVVTFLTCSFTRFFIVLFTEIAFISLILHFEKFPRYKILRFLH